MINRRRFLKFLAAIPAALVGGKVAAEPGIVFPPAGGEVGTWSNIKIIENPVANDSIHYAKSIRQIEADMAGLDITDELDRRVWVSTQTVEPLSIDGEECFTVVMNPLETHKVRKAEARGSNL